MNLKDANLKMSKSSRNENSKINLLDTPDIIKHKIIKAKTDSIQDIYYDPNRKELANLIRIFAELKDSTPEIVSNQYNWGDVLKFKNDLIDALVEELNPIREKTLELIESQELKDELEEGLIKAKKIASKNMDEIKSLIGFVN
jgi:tryptophanyl-tRNA synthetase